MAETESATIVEPKTGGGEEQQAGPCNVYRVDLTATGFAICKCGYPRDAHVEKQENRASMALKNLQKKNVRNESGFSNGEGKPCKVYRVDVSAANFGDCKCGFPKDAHVEKDMNNAAKALKKLRSTQSAKDNFRPRTGKPCNNYKVDMTAEVFGTCLCGFAKEDHIEKEENHAAQALRKLKEKNALVNKANDLKAEGADDEAEKILSKLEKKAEKKGPSNTTGSSSGAIQDKASSGCCTIS